MKVGFIGLGIMGKPMAKNLFKGRSSGFASMTFKKEAVEELVAAGATAGATNAEAAKGVDVIITMVPNSPNVREALLGKNGAAEGADKDTVVIDMSSIDPVESKKIAAELKERTGMEMLDCPVSGGEPKAIDGTLSIMCSGKKEIFDKYTDLLKAMGSSVVYVGEIGSGNVAKLANQMVVAAKYRNLRRGNDLCAKNGNRSGVSISGDPRRISRFYGYGWPRFL